jgi:hypothetical protein
VFQGWEIGESPDSPLLAFAGGPAIVGHGLARLARRWIALALHDEFAGFTGP